MVGHPVEHPALPVQGQLAVQGDETVKGEEVLQKGDHGGDAPVATNSLMPFFRRALQAPQGRGGYPAAPFGEWSNRVPSMSKKIALIIK